MILNYILAAIQIISVILLPFLFALKTPRTIYAKKRYYLLAVVIFMALMMSTLYFRNDFYTMPMMAISYVIICQLLFNRGKVALFYQFTYMIILYIIQLASQTAALILYSYATSMDGLLLSGIAIGLSAVLQIVYTLLMIQLVNIRRISDISRKQLIGLFIIPFFSIFNLMSMFIAGEIFYLRYGYGILIVNIVFLLVINFYCIYLYYEFSRNQELKKQLELNRQQNEMAYKYYEAMDLRIERSRKVIHDVRNHMNAIEQLYMSGDTAGGQAYVSDIHTLLDSLGIVHYANNRMLNMILNDKMAHAKRLGIQTDIHLEQLNVDFMKDMDITTIFSNLLDNAIEACGKIPDAVLEVKSACFNDMMTIHIKNSVKEDMALNLSHIRTTKRGHTGIGLDNVIGAVKRYSGDLNISCKNKIFSVHLLFPLK